MAEVKLLTEAEWRNYMETLSYEEIVSNLRERGLIAPEPVDPFAILNRSGGNGPHLDKANATFPQLAQWAEDAASNIENGWRNVDVFSGCMGGWEQTLLRHLAKELRLAHDSLAALRRGREIGLAERPQFTREQVMKAVRPHVKGEGLGYYSIDYDAIYAAMTEALNA